ncbi:unnamed protein product, partial [Symbiodinium sp. KB8]
MGKWTSLCIILAGYLSAGGQVAALGRCLEPQPTLGEGIEEGFRKTSFPAYDDRTRAQQLAREERAAGNRPVPMGPHYPGEDSSMTHDLQECINATRRAEQKVRSLTATRRQKQQLWTKWLDDMKLSYMKEQQRHQRDMERLSKELEEAIRAQEAARASCRAVAIGELAVEDEAMGDDAAGWDGMLQEWRAERADSENSDAVLRRALAAPQRLRSEGSTQQFSTPPRRGVPSMPLTPPAPSAAAMTQSTMPEAIVKDPYMTSPSHSTLPDGMEEHVAAEATASPTQQRPRQAKPRQSVKHLPTAIPHSATPGAGLADKLDHKRAQYLEHMAKNPAMQPFRLPGPPSGPPSEPPPQPPQSIREVGNGVGHPPQQHTDETGKGYGKENEATKVTIRESDTDEDEVMGPQPPGWRWPIMWLFAAILGGHCPIQVWAVPEHLREAILHIQEAAIAFPDPFPGRHGNDDVGAATQVTEWAALEACPDHPAEPQLVPVTILAAGYESGHVLVPKTNLQVAAELLPEALKRWPSRPYEATAVLADPQPFHDHITAVLIPPWAFHSSSVIVVFDSSHWNGPVYADFMTGHLFFSDLEEAASRQSIDAWDAFLGSQPSPLKKGTVTKVTQGMVLKFVPVWRKPDWGPDLDPDAKLPSFEDGPRMPQQYEIASQGCLTLCRDSERFFVDPGDTVEELQTFIAVGMHTTAELMSYGRIARPMSGPMSGWHNASRLLGYFDLKPPVGFELEISGTHQALEDITPADPVEVDGQDAREEDDVLRHGHIILPAVQPDNSFAIVLALPEWSSGEFRDFAATILGLVPGCVGTHNPDLQDPDSAREEGRVDLQALSDQYGADAPEGYCVNIKDSQLCPLESREVLTVAHGGMLVLEFTLEFLEDSGHSQDQDSPQSGDEEGDESSSSTSDPDAESTDRERTGDPYYVGVQSVWLPHPVEVNAACAEIQRYRDALWATFLALPAWAGEEEDIQLQPGLCITIMPRGQPPPPILDIEVFANVQLRAFQSGLLFLPSFADGAQIFTPFPWLFLWICAQITHGRPLLTFPVRELAAVSPQRAEAVLKAVPLLVNPDLQTSWVCYTDGSFYAATALRAEQLGWAFIFVEPQQGFLAWLSGAVPDWAVREAGRASAYLAECFALCIAQLCAALHFGGYQITFRSDCQSAVGLAKGTMSYLPGATPQALAHVVAFRRGLIRAHDNIEYVPGHAGNVLNEAADTLAKLGARSQCFCTGPTECTALLKHWLQRGGHRFPWAATALCSLSGDSCLPPIQGDLGDDTNHGPLTAHQLVEPFLPAAVTDACSERASMVQAMRLNLLVCARKAPLKSGNMLDSAQEMALPINAKKGAPKKVPWSVSSHAHAAIVVKHLQDGLRALAPGPDGIPGVLLKNFAAECKPGGNVVFGAHLTRSFLRWQAAKKKSCFILFTDIASAFYSVVRQLVASGGMSSGSGLSLEGLNLPPEDIAALLEHAAQPSAVAEAGATSWLEAVAHRLTDATWFVLQQDHTPVVTSRGTRPGSSWADILFSFVVKKILQRRDVLMGCNPCQAVRAVNLPCDGSVSLCLRDTDSNISLDDLIWADDIATMRAANTAADLQPAMQSVAGNTCDAFTEHGFRLSFGRNKTATLAQPAGHGARAVRRSLFGHRGLQGTLPTLRENDAPAQIPLVSVYKHLGAQISISGKMEDEIAYRVAQARAAFAEGRRKVFKELTANCFTAFHLFEFIARPPAGGRFSHPGGLGPAGPRLVMKMRMADKGHRILAKPKSDLRARIARSQGPSSK